MAKSDPTANSLQVTLHRVAFISGIIQFPFFNIYFIASQEILVQLGRAGFSHSHCTGPCTMEATEHWATRGIQSTPHPHATIF